MCRSDRCFVATQTWASFVALVTLIVLVGCTSTAPKAVTVPDTRTYLGYSVEAIARNDWEAAYRLMEDALVAEDPALRQEANDLVEKYPQIRDAAFTSFSKASLENTYSSHGERAWSIEEKRLLLYQRTLATPEQARQAWFNFKEVYAERILRAEAKNQALLDTSLADQESRAEFAQEIEHAHLAGNITLRGNVEDLLRGLKIGQTSRKQAIASFGRPSRSFESNKILTWAVRVENDQYYFLQDFIRTRDGVTHSLILVFDESRLLTAARLVKVIK
jgi:hypothetical protein